MDPGTLSSTLAGLSEVDLAKLKATCAEVLQNPSAHSAETLAVCRVVASI